MKIVPYPVDFGAMPECNRCGGCCGPVGVTREELDSITEFCHEQGIGWAECSPFDCGFLDKHNDCLIYEVRPFICRIYGVTKQVTCPVFPRLGTQDFPPSKAREMGYVKEDMVLLSEIKEALSSPSGTGKEALVSSRAT
jgi:hypothetical protein